MIATVTYARLYNLGNYENERLEVTVTTENGDAAAAFAMAKAATDAEHDRLVAEREAEIERQRAERQAEYEARRAQSAAPSKLDHS